MKRRYKISNVCKCLLLVLGLHYKGEGAGEDITVGEVQDLLRRISTIENRITNTLSNNPNITRVIVLGNTGSGKSSLVHALAGKTMQAKKKNGKYIVEVDLRPENQIPNFIVSDGVAAGTREPTAHLHLIDYRNAVAAGTREPTAHLQNAVVFWDCPGFMDPGGVSRDIVTLFAIDRLFTSPSRVKVLLSLDRDSFDANRGQDVVLRLKKLLPFFRDENKLKQAVSIVMTKQLWDDDDINPLDAGEMFISAYNPIQDPAEIGLTDINQLNKMRDIITHLRNSGNRIFSFPRPKERREHNYAEDPTLFPDRGRILGDFVNNPASNPEINIYSDFASDERVQRLMLAGANQINAAVDQLHEFFRYVGDITGDKNILEQAKQALNEISALPDDRINTPAKIAREIRNKNFNLSPAQSERGYQILNTLSANEAYMQLIDKLNGGNTHRNRWFEGLPNLPVQVRALASHPLAVLQAAIDRLWRAPSGDRK